LALAIDDKTAPKRNAALHSNLGQTRITGSDISIEALRYARANRASLGLQNRVDLVQGDLLDWTGGPWDLILSNPPYLSPDQIDGNLEITAEPRLALDGGENGVELIARILDRAATVAAPRFAMIVELDPNHAHAVRAMAAAHFPDADVIIVPDLTGRDRFLSIEREECAP
jgi:release factor glutamine methyltransferase